MTRGNDDRIVSFIVVDRVDVRPIAAGTRPRNVAESVLRFELGDLLGRQRLAD